MAPKLAQGTQGLSGNILHAPPPGLHHLPTIKLTLPSSALPNYFSPLSCAEALLPSRRDLAMEAIQLAVLKPATRPLYPWWQWAQDEACDTEHGCCYLSKDVCAAAAANKGARQSRGVWAAGYFLWSTFQGKHVEHYLSTSKFFRDLFHSEVFQGFSSSHGPFFAWHSWAEWLATYTAWKCQALEAIFLILFLCYPLAQKV